MSVFDDIEEVENKEDVMPKVLQKELPKKEKHQPVSMAVWFGIVFGVAASVFIGWNFIAPKFKKTETSEVPLIKRSSSPVKVRPSDPGGMDIPNRDRRVYARIESGNDEPVVEKLLPPPEQPLAPEVKIVNNNEEEYIFEDIEDLASNEVFTEEEKIKENVVKQDDTKLVLTKTETKEVKIEPEKIEVKTEIKTEPEKELQPVAIAKPEIIAPREEVKEVKPVEVKPMTGTWKVQLLSVKDKIAVEKEWESVSQKHQDVLSGISHIIETADLGDKGIFYRLKIGGYENRSDADALCEKLKAKKQGCFVVK